MTSAPDCVKSKDLDLADSFNRDFLIFLAAQAFVSFLSLLFCFLLNTGNVAHYAPSNLYPAEHNSGRHGKRGKILPQQVHSELFQRPKLVSQIKVHFKIIFLKSSYFYLKNNKFV